MTIVGQESIKWLILRNGKGYYTWSVWIGEEEEEDLQQGQSDSGVAAKKAVANILINLAMRVES